MNTVPASKARIPVDSFNRVAYRGERIKVAHRSGQAIYLISEEDLELLETVENYLDLIEAKAAVRDIEEGRMKTVSWEEAKRRLGL